MLVNRTISYLGYSSKPCHLCIALVLSNKKIPGYFSTDFLLHLSLPPYENVYSELSLPEIRIIWL